MTEEEIRKMVNDSFFDNIMNNLDSSIIFKYIEGLEKEIEELKKQLENCYCNRTDCSSRIKDSKKYDSIAQKYDKALKILIEYGLLCDIDDFMNKNVDYCSMNCGVDEEVFKKCWNKYIEQSLKEVK